MYYYILNPAAAKVSQSGFETNLRNQLNALGIGGEFVKTTGTGDATKLAKMGIEKGYTTIVAVGGDGIVNEVVNGITRPNVAVGIIPAGNSNRIAASLGIMHWQQAAQVLAARRITPYGLIAAGQNFFLSTLTLGFDTEVDKQVDPSAAKGLRSRLGHMTASFRHARKFEPLRCRIQVDNNFKLECDLFSLAVSNQKFANPLADNRLVVSIRDQPGHRDMATYLWARARGLEVIEDAATTKFLANRVVIETTPPTGIMVDGNLVTRTPIAIRITERQVRFITERQDGVMRSGT